MFRSVKGEHIEKYCKATWEWLGQKQSQAKFFLTSAEFPFKEVFSVFQLSLFLIFVLNDCLASRKWNYMRHADAKQIRNRFYVHWWTERTEPTSYLRNFVKKAKTLTCVSEPYKGHNQLLRGLSWRVCDALPLPGYFFRGHPSNYLSSLFTQQCCGAKTIYFQLRLDFFPYFGSGSSST